MTTRISLADACLEVVDCVNRTAPETIDGEYFAIGTPAMRGNMLDLEQARRISKDTFATWTRRLVPVEGDLLLAREAPVGPVIRIPAGGKYAAGQRTTHLRANPAIVDPGFLYYLLVSPTVQSRLVSGAMGSTVAHLRVADVKNFQLPELPDLWSQRAIAEVLGALDDKIAANRKLAETSDQLAAAMFRHAQLDAASGALGDVLSLNYGKALPATKRLGGGVPVIGSGGVTGYHNEALIDGPAVVVGRKGTIGAVHWSNVPTYPIDTTFFVVPVSEGTIVYLYYLLRSLDWSEYNSDSAVPGLNRDQALRRSIPIVDDQRMSKFSTRAGELLRIQDQLSVESRTLSTLRDALLPRLMSGELRVRDAERVVEAAL
ncbi:restriction endonuclease subunit S [Prescottella sp. R16]|uniref:restriction endonuclease subunit S n=1 Tax=Prescottella sp. R16 TaxID=3064529 RepID=UPI00272E7C08|nr:restriction endonuclease subunit S [Prescottella sp. R16]